MLITFAQLSSDHFWRNQYRHQGYISFVISAVRQANHWYWAALASYQGTHLPLFIMTTWFYRDDARIALDPSKEAEGTKLSETLAFVLSEADLISAMHCLFCRHR